MSSNLSITNCLKGELEKEVTFEVSKTQTIKSRITFNKGDLIEKLINRMNEMQEEINELKMRKKITTEVSLIKDWDNEYDEQWNEV